MSHALWEAITLLFASMILIRIAGKKSMAQMTGLETVVILAIGTTMGHATRDSKFSQVLVILIAFVLILIVVQYIQMKFKPVEKYLIGTAIVFIKYGVVLTEDIKKCV